MTDTKGSPIAKRLRSTLGGKAGAHARASLSAYQLRKIETFYVEAGIALELAMKAKLAGISPYLLAPDGHNWFKHGHKFAQGVTAENGLRSVSAEEALARLKTLDPTLIVGISTHVVETIGRRDQSVHMGVFTEPNDETLVAHAATFVEAINGLLLTSPETFWGDLAELAAALVDTERDAVRIRVASKLTAARAALAGLTEDQCETLSENGVVYVEHFRDERPELLLLPCPVCGYEGVADGELTDDGEPDFDWNPDGILTSWVYDINTVITRFECKVCRLKLSGVDEIGTAGLPAKMANEYADPSLL